MKSAERNCAADDFNFKKTDAGPLHGTPVSSLSAVTFARVPSRNCRLWRGKFFRQLRDKGTREESWLECGAYPAMTGVIIGGHSGRSLRGATLRLLPT